METVKNAAEAKDWFINHSEGEVICQDTNGLTKVVGSFPEAEEFFTEDTDASEDVAEDASEISGGEADRGELPTSQGNPLISGIQAL